MTGQRTLLHLWFVMMVILTGCASAKPVSNGSQIDLPDPGVAVVVWGNHAGASGEVVTLLQQRGYRVVERSRLRQVFDEQKIILTQTPDDEAQLLKVGKLLGAGVITFVDTHTSSTLVRNRIVNRRGGSARTETIIHASVSVRGVDIETGEVMWTGTAHYTQSIENPEAGLIDLTQAAVARGLCPTWAWREGAEKCDQSSVAGSGDIGVKFARKGLPQERHLFVAAVAPGSPGDQAGLKVGDELLSCNGKSDIRSRMQYLESCRVESGQPVMLQVKRQGKVSTVSVTANVRTEFEKY